MSVWQIPNLEDKQMSGSEKSFGKLEGCRKSKKDRAPLG